MAAAKAGSPSGWSDSDDGNGASRDAAASRGRSQATSNTSGIGSVALAACLAQPIVSMAMHRDSASAVAAKLLGGLEQRCAEARVCLREEYSRIGATLPVALGLADVSPSKRTRQRDSGASQAAGSRSSSSSTGAESTVEPKRSKTAQDAASGGQAEASTIAEQSARGILARAATRTGWPPSRGMDGNEAKKTLGKAVSVQAQPMYKAKRINGGSQGFKTFCRTITRAAFKQIQPTPQGTFLADTRLLQDVAAGSVASFFNSFASFRPID